jgi:glycosyltransferase involved in cell wall biosynthesis
MAIPERYRTAQPPNPAPTVSIVTPTLNQGIYLEKTIQSVLDQGYPSLEYIVQDGLSNDSTPQVLERYADRLAHWESCKDTGQSNAINLGFAHASGDIMAYLNSDDLLLPGAINFVASYFASHPEVDVVYGHRVVIDNVGNEIGRWILPPHEDNVLKWADFIPQETLFWRRRIWEKVGGSIDESFRFAMDWDLVLRFWSAGATFARLPRFLGAFRYHPEQKTSAFMEGLGEGEMARLRQRCHGHPVTQAQISLAVLPYLLKHVACHYLYRLRIFRY